MVAENRRGSCRKRTFGASLSTPYLKAPEVTRRNMRVHFIHPLKERIVREVDYGQSLKLHPLPIWSSQCEPHHRRDLEGVALRAP
jgi:hypothetical protein